MGCDNATFPMHFQKCSINECQENDFDSKKVLQWKLTPDCIHLFKENKWQRTNRVFTFNSLCAFHWVNLPFSIPCWIKAFAWRRRGEIPTAGINSHIQNGKKKKQQQKKRDIRRNIAHCLATKRMKTISILTTRWCCNAALKTQTYNQVCCVDLCFAPRSKTLQQNHFPHKARHSTWTPTLVSSLLNAALLPGCEDVDQS